jgi:hypothetical protein
LRRSANERSRFDRALTVGLDALQQQGVAEAEAAQLASLAMWASHDRSRHACS